jgi:DNA polymerase-3 subunit epsilon
MLKNLTLERPLAVLDLETTGTDPDKDRIVEVSVLRLSPGREAEHWTRRVNPGVPIPPAATAVHGITETDVADAPRFAEVVQDLLAFLDGCDLCGFNLKRFDLRLLYTEVARAGLTLPLAGRALVDPMEIFHAYEPRDLSAAVRFYCGREHENAHAAAADVLATVAVLDAMVARYADLPRDVAGLHQRFKDSKSLDSSGHFVRVQGEIRFAFGKYRGQPLDVIARTKPDYLEWMLKENFFDDTKAIVRDALKKWGKPEAGIIPLPVSPEGSASERSANPRPDHRR